MNELSPLLVSLKYHLIISKIKPRISYLETCFNTSKHAEPWILELPRHLIFFVEQVVEVHREVESLVRWNYENFSQVNVDGLIRTELQPATFRGTVVVYAHGIKVGRNKDILRQA